MAKRTVITLIMLASLASVSIARNPTVVSKRTSTEVDTILACRAVVDSQARLACYDDRAAKLSAAVAHRDVVVIDKVQAREASRSLFGFSVPNFGGLFGGGDGIKQIDSTVASVGHNGDGGLIVTLADGSIWSQTDDTMTFPPKQGEKVTVSRGMLGSFFVNPARSTSFKAKRVG